mmetsp:Transcript_113268/g.283708  ORF Transcript_113268/g.283708 Transcript_113268/m.283708 type:complete len:296 (-) Transcript_113268:41-928(-)
MTPVVMRTQLLQKPWSPPVVVIIMRLLLSVPQCALGGPSGLFLVGSSGFPGEPPVLSFGRDPATAVALTIGADGDGLEVRRAGAKQLSISEGVSELQRTVSAGEVMTESISVGGVPQWFLWDLDTFDTAGTGQWTMNARSVCGAPNDLFLGGHCRLGAASTARRYENLPPHTRVRVRARVHYFDEWQGEDVAMQVDGNSVWAQAHDWCPGFLTWMCIKYGVDACGGDTPDRLSVKVEAILPHASSTLDLAFTSSLPSGTDSCRVSWGVDDISIELMMAPGPAAAADADCGQTAMV